LLLRGRLTDRPEDLLRALEQSERAAREGAGAVARPILLARADCLDALFLGDDARRDRETAGGSPSAPPGLASGSPTLPNAPPAGTPGSSGAGLVACGPSA